MEEVNRNRTSDSRPERVIVAAVCTGDERETAESVEELVQLADTAGAQVVGRVIQNLESGPGYVSGRRKNRRNSQHGGGRRCRCTDL